jgi:hypothetical protein
VSLRPKIYDEFAIVHRRDAELSRATREVVALAVARMKGVGAAVRPG